MSFWSLHTFQYYVQWINDYSNREPTEITAMFLCQYLVNAVHTMDLLLLNWFMSSNLWINTSCFSTIVIYPSCSSYENIWKHDSPPAGNRKRRTARGITRPSISYPEGRVPPTLARGAPTLAGGYLPWPRCVPTLAGGYLPWPRGMPTLAGGYLPWPGVPLPPVLTDRHLPSYFVRGR